MAGFYGRNDYYEKDPLDEIRDNYDSMDSDDELHRLEDGFNQDVVDETSITVWHCELSDLLEELGFHYEIDLEKEPRDRILRLFNHYDPLSITYDENGDSMYINPLPYYHFEGEDDKKGLFDLGYKIGIGGTLGEYYKFLPIIDFSRGYWLGLFRRGMEEKDDSIVQKVSKEIELYDPSIVKEEMSRIISSSYTPPTDNFGVYK